MTKTLEAALAKVREWPDTRQEDAARLLLAMHEQSSMNYSLSADQIARVRTSKAQADAGEFVADADVDEFFAKHGA